MLRWKMNKIIRLLEADPKNQQVLEPKYRKALITLSDNGCIKLLRDWNGNIFRVTLLDHYATYQLNRRELWANRIISFILGITTSVLAAIITGILRL